MKNKIIYLSFLGIVLSFSLSYNSYAQQSESIGTFMAVIGNTSVTHSGAKEKMTVKLRDNVLFKDIIETLEKSKAKVLFLDDTILNIGENTKIEITEHIFDPDKDKRSAIIKLLNGKVRALVGRFFSGPDSKFEIHTPTAVAAARGSYGIFWVAEVEGKIQTGVLNLKGSWEVKNIDPAIVGSIILKEGEFSQIGIGLPPVLLPEARPEIIAATEVKNQRKEEAPKKEDIAGKDISGERFIPVSGIISQGLTTTKEGGEKKEAGTDETIGTTTTIIATIPPIQQQPPPITTPVHVEINFR